MKMGFDNTMQNKSKYNQTLPGLLKQTNLRISINSINGFHLLKFTSTRLPLLKHRLVILPYSKQKKKHNFF